MGNSRGRWDGDALVVDVTDQMADTWFDRSGNYHGEALRVTERYTPITPYHLQYEATIDDPEVFPSRGRSCCRSTEWRSTRGCSNTAAWRWWKS